MSIVGSENKNQKGSKQMENRNLQLERTSDGIGWGLLFILIGSLFFAQNKGWLGGQGWAYFAMGLGVILVIGSLVRYFGGNNRWSAFGRLVIGLALVYVGISSIYGFGEWWPAVLIVIGIACLVNAFWGNKQESYTH
jgi:hypothetical protein